MHHICLAQSSKHLNSTTSVISTSTVITRTHDTKKVIRGLLFSLKIEVVWIRTRSDVLIQRIDTSDVFRIEFEIKDFKVLFDA